MAWPFSRRKSAPQLPDYERAWIAFHVDQGADYGRVGFSQQNMDAYAIHLPMLVADAMLCNFGDMPGDGMSLLHAIAELADEKVEQAKSATNQDELTALRLASRVRDWAPDEFSDDVFDVHCEVDISDELERITVMTPFSPPEAATPEVCRELTWIAWDWVAQGSGLHPGRAALAAESLSLLAGVVLETGGLPSALDRGIAPWIAMVRFNEKMHESEGR
jgi:hypothetical protein